jgi:NADH:ubiquinone oxidoreductase subunit F (NADH-binding)
MAVLGSNLLDKKISSARWKDELLPLSKDLGETMILASICGLGRSVPAPLKSVTDYFSADLTAYLGDEPAGDSNAQPASQAEGNG